MKYCNNQYNGEFANYLGDNNVFSSRSNRCGGSSNNNLETSSFAQIYTNDCQELNPFERVIFNRNNIRGNDISTALNSQDISLEGGASYLIQYNLTIYACDVPNGQSRDVSFALTFANDTIVPGSRQATSVSPSGELNSLGASVIVNTKCDTVIRLTYVDGGNNPPDPVYVSSASLTVIRIR